MIKGPHKEENDIGIVTQHQATEDFLTICQEYHVSGLQVTDTAENETPAKGKTTIFAPVIS